MKKRVLGLAAATAMAASLLAVGATPVMADDVYNVSLQFPFPEESAEGVLGVLSQIEEASEGRINFEVYYSYSFVDAGDVVDALETNQLNIAGFMPTEHSIFALNGHMTALPLMNYPSWEAATKIYLSMVYNNEDMLAEYTNNGLTFWGGYMCPGYNVYSTKEITDFSPNAFAGLTVMCDNSEMQTLINTYKGGAITAFTPDYLSNLQNGVADALVQHLNCAYVFGCLDYVKSALFFGDGGFYNLPLVYCMSETFWNSLPEDLQQIFAEYADDFSKAGYEGDLALYTNVAYPTLEEKAEITVLNDEQIAEWQAAAEGIVTDALDGITRDNAAAPDAYAQLKDMIANYDDAAFEIGTNNFGIVTEW